MKTKILITIALLCFIGFSSCDDGDNPGSGGNPSELQTQLFDFLKGDWGYVKFVGGFVGEYTWDSATTTIKFLSQNDDTTINYEVIVEDTLFYKGKLSYQYIESINNSLLVLKIKLPYEDMDGNNNVRIDIVSESSPTDYRLVFYDGVNCAHYYKKIKAGG